MMNERELGTLIGRLNEFQRSLEYQINQIREDFKKQDEHQDARFTKIFSWLEGHNKDITRLQTMQKVIVGTFSFIIATVAGWLGLK